MNDTEVTALTAFMGIVRFIKVNSVFIRFKTGPRYEHKKFLFFTVSL